MDTKTLHAMDQTHIWHPFTQAMTSPSPVAIREGRGTVLVDTEGREILDLVSSWWVNLHGHGHPAIASAIGRQAAQLEHVIFAGFTHEPAVTLSQRITQILPDPLNRVFFSDNGSTAVEVALKMALQARRNRDESARTRFLAFDGGYHGDTVGAMSAGISSRFFEAWREMMFSVDVLPVAHTWDDDEKIEAKEAEALATLDQHLEQHGNQTIAAIIEPLVQGASGMQMHRPTFLRAAVERLRQKGILVIFDEVMTGFGRLGELFACLHTGVTPDIICLSKGLTGGFLPMGLTVTTDAIHDIFLDKSVDKAFLHGHSFTANPLGCAAALASLDLLLTDECKKARQRIESRYRRDLAQVVAQSPLACHWRVQGTLAAFDLDLKENAYGSSASASLKQFFLSRGLLLRPLGSTLYLLPPYCILDDELDRAFEGIEAALRDLAG